jgi:hypothetical protein
MILRNARAGEPRTEFYPSKNVGFSFRAQHRKARQTSQNEGRLAQNQLKVKILIKFSHGISHLSIGPKGEKSSAECKRLLARQTLSLIHHIMQKTIIRC